MTTASGPATGAPRRWPYLVAALLLVAAAIAAISVSATTTPNQIAGTVGLSDLGPAPPLRGGGDWLNTAPLTTKDLRGKVVLYDFWTYSCVNCVRTLPYLRSWAERYEKDGLIVVGVHSPEFQFERERDNVERAVSDLNVGYPVVLDNQLAIWSAFENRYWPTKYLADRTGRIRFLHIGEGDYTNTENLLRRLLGLAKSSPRAVSPDLPPGGRPPTVDDGLTPETYLGTDRGTTNAIGGTHGYPDPDPELPTDAARIAGVWTATPQYLRSGESGSTIFLRYNAREVNLVMATDDGKPVDVDVLVDGKALAPSYRTTQTRVASDGRTSVRVSESDMYRIVLGPAIETHTLQLVARAPGLRAFAFTFGA